MADKKDPADGSGSKAARDADAVDEVERNTKSQTTASSYTTTDHDVIRTWAESRGGRPASVETTGDDGDDAGLLRIEFPDAPGGSADNLDEVDWEPFFKTFDDRKLSFVYQEKTSDGSTSRFFRFVRADG
ncbi:hypothetical protein [Nakamurella endophytica]|uniref:1,4-alpha-glucan branching enzyme n=1 Tax=Nakamurella endophytica TaxID=1748367 RepID=A0A917W8X3_9ACTN|nr:hypothetical protein [Nakamurella endophytica]GGL84428.1 hypothetical protein GCM10011594_00080 [Nakamurella endophytica]